MSFTEEIAALKARFARLLARIERGIAKDGGFAAPLRSDPTRWVTVTPSTRPGIRWQITFWDGDPLGPSASPTGHIDVSGHVEAAARELFGMVDSP